MWTRCHCSSWILFLAQVYQLSSGMSCIQAKWGKFVPAADRKAGLCYYVEEPPVTVKKKIAAQRAQDKSAREKRSREGTETSNGMQMKACSKENLQKQQQNNSCGNNDCSLHLSSIVVLEYDFQ